MQSGSLAGGEKGDREDRGCKAVGGFGMPGEAVRKMPQSGSFLQVPGTSVVTYLLTKI